MGGPLGRGKLDGCVAHLPLARLAVRRRTGENEFDRAIRLETYEVVVEDGEVKVAL